MGWIIGKGIGVPFRLGGSGLGSSYWATREPSGIAVTITGATTATVTWTDSAVLGADGYNVYADSTLKATVAIGVQTADLTGLTADTLYTFKIVAYKGSNESTGISASAVTALEPDDVADLFIWFNSDNVTNTGGKASQLTDLSGNGRHATNAGGADYYPTITATALNGHNKLTFNGVKNRLLTDAFTQNQPYTILLLAKFITGGEDNALMGTKAIPLSALPFYKTLSGGIGTALYAGTFIIVEPGVQSTDLSLFTFIMDGIGSLYKRNTNEFRVITSPGANNLTAGLNIGGYADADSTVSNFDFYEFCGYSGVLAELSKLQVIQYLQLRYALNLNVEQKWITDGKQGIERIADSFDNSVQLSDQGTYINRSCFSEFSFNTTDEYVFVTAVAQMGVLVHLFNTVGVYEDDVYKGTIYFKGTTARGFQLSTGNKKVTLVSGGVTKYNATFLNPNGIHITSIKVNDYTHVNEGTVATKIITIGDSISVGGDYATIPCQQAFPRLFKVEDGISSACLGIGAAELKDYAENSTAVDRTVAWIVSLVTNVTTRKICIVALGTNDFGLRSTAAATFQGWYENLLDAIHVADANIEVFCLSPLIRDDDDTLLDDYRTAIGTVCTARATYATHIAGKTILSLPADFGADGLHPTVAGSKKLKDALYAVIFP